MQTKILWIETGGFHLNTSQYRFTLDLQSTQSQVCIPVTRGDTARTWLISFRDGSKTYTLTDGCLAKLEILRPTGTRLEEFCAIEKNEAVRYSFSQNKNTAAVEGFHECAVVLYDEEGNVMGSPRFSMIVSGRVINTDDIKLSDDDKLLLDAIASEEAYRQSAENERSNAEETRNTSELQRTEAEESRCARFEAIQSIAASLVSPTINVTPIDGGQMVTVTDANAKQTFRITNGNTPIKGIDYFTQADKDELTLLVIEALGGQPIFGYVDENNNIVIHAPLANGTYTAKYEMSDGSTVDIGELSLGDTISVKANLTNCFLESDAIHELVRGESYTAKISANDGYEFSSVSVTMGTADITSGAVSVNGSTANIHIASVSGNLTINAEAALINVLPLAIHSDGTPFVGADGQKGYKTGVRISGSSGGETIQADCMATGFIALRCGEKAIVKNITLHSNENYNVLNFYDESFVKVGNTTVDGNLVDKPSSGVYVIQPHVMSGAESVRYIRFSCETISENTVITVHGV